VGHADKRELLPKGRSYYGSNGSLAYQRALEVKKELLKAYTAGPKRPLSSEELSWRTIVLSAGPNNVGKEVTMSGRTIRRENDSDPWNSGPRISACARTIALTIALENGAEGSQMLMALTPL